MKFYFKIQNIPFKLNTFIHQHNPTNTTILEIEKNNRLYHILKRNMRLYKVRISLEHENIKKIYNEIHDIIGDNQIAFNVRNILYFIGLVIMNKYALVKFKKIIYNTIKSLDNSYINDIIKDKIKDIIDSCIYIIIKIKKILKLEFKLKNRYIIINKINKKWI